jgi:protease IV
MNIFSKKNNPELSTEEREKQIIYQLANDYQKEKTRTRRWGIFFKLLLAIYLVTITSITMIDLDGIELNSKEESHVALIKLQGVISFDKRAGANKIIPALRDAFENEKSQAIILQANSPGGSPVQSGYIYDEIVRLSKKHPDKKLYTVMSDVCASGCYYIAAASHQIYADKASLVGSIGVRMGSFGFVDTLKILGMERRVLTAGKNKALNDPFIPENSETTDYLKTHILDKTHQQFIQAVKEGRGERLKETEDTFSGLIWTGEESLELGMIDGLGSSYYVAETVIGNDNLVSYTIEPSYREILTKRLSVFIQNTLSTLVQQTNQESTLLFF